MRTTFNDEDFFNVTRLHRDDIRDISSAPCEYSDEDMEAIAEILSEYQSETFWENLAAAVHQHKENQRSQGTIRTAE